MMSQQAALEYAKDMMDDGMSAEDANVEIVRMMGVRLVKGKIDAQTRKALNAAVRDGRLGHLNKDGLRPEAYYHPNAKGHAIEMRDREAHASIQAVKDVCA